MSKHVLYIGCALGALVTFPAAAQTNGTPTRQADTVDAQSQASSSPSVSNADAAAAGQDQADPGVDARGRRRVRVEERDVVVTGSRFQQILDQPQSKSVINAEERNLAGIGDVRQLIEVQPGFNYTPEFGISVRGVGRQTAQTLLGAENAVVQYVDGFLSLTPGNIAESTLFGGNVQFVRGPSGTQYGRNSIAGSINLISRAPTRENTAQVVAGFGRGGWRNIGANIAGPLSDKLGFRIGIQQFVSPSLSKNLSGPTLDSKKPGFAINNLYLEFQLDGRFGPFHFRNRLTTFSYDNQPGYASFERYSNNLPSGRPAATFTFPSINAQYGFDGPAPAQRLQTNVNFAGYDRLRDNWVNIFNADLDLGGATLVYVGGYNQYWAYGSADLDQTSRTFYNSSTVNPPPLPNPAFGFLGYAPNSIIPTDVRSRYDNRNHYWSQEARLESKPGHAFQWVLGGYYLNQHFDEQYEIGFANGGDALLRPGVSYTDATPGEINPNRSTYRQRNRYDIRSTAAFGNIIWDLAEQFRIDAGVRYTWDEKNATTRYRNVYFYPPVYAAYTEPAQGATTFRRDQGLSGRAALAWRPEKGSQIYVAYQRGYQASAFTLGQGLPGVTGRDNIADSEHLDVYEIGGFGTLGQFRFDGSVFYQNFFDQQIPITVLGAPTPLPGGGTAPGPLFTRFTNAEKSRIYGTEAQITWRPNTQSSIVASYTYLNPTFRNFGGVVDVTQPCSLVDLPVGQQCTTATNPGYVAPTNPAYQQVRDLSGNEIPRTPRNKATLYGYYGIDLGAGGFLYPGGSISYQSRYYYNAFNNPQSLVPGRTIVGLTLTYRTANQRYEVTGSVTNLLDKAYYDYRTIQDAGTSYASFATGYGAPRFWTVTGRVRF